MIEGMLHAESRTKTAPNTSWSPKFADAVNKKMFWKVALSLRMTHKRPSADFLQWAEKLNIQGFTNIHTSTIKQNYRTAQRELKTVEKEAEELREEHLRSLLTEAELNGDDQKAERRIKILLRAHERKQHFQRLKNILKPREAGGLSYILVPENFSIDQFPYEPSSIQNWEAIHDQDLVQRYIQQRNLIHFG
jgi:hypothetical protein